MVTPLIVIKDSDIEVTASDFAKPFILRKFCGPFAMSLYVELRARGFDPVSSFATAFGSAIIGHPDEVSKAAAAFETSSWYQSELPAVRERIGTDALLAEYECRAAELSSFTTSLAFEIPVEPEPVSAYTAARDEEEYSEHVKQQTIRKHLRAIKEGQASQPSFPDYEQERARTAGLGTFFPANGQ
ncbi:hypothetical protein [Paraburkholderia saeva]|uniref:hypothetical protein n=1 Tax=Paraburkholderia saeva TaxID=2777537 RepID=UPI001DF65256|nr:hypothetical protein [Paraburkholderia saeva]CAG4916148.1 hypothetical protein R70241_04419 [Paraburkholderia saeva]